MSSKISGDVEPVLVIHDYWDEPRAGVALFEGTACYFKCIFDEKLDDYSNRYCLTPLTDEALAAFKEQAKIFRRWRAAYLAGKAKLNTGPALSAEKSRYEILTRALNETLIIGSGQDFYVTGSFSVASNGQTTKKDSDSSWQIIWNI
jgi:hypothetical protein